MAPLGTARALWWRMTSGRLVWWVFNSSMPRRIAIGLVLALLWALPASKGGMG